MRDRYEALIERAVRGNALAERFLLDVWYVASTWDDIVDMDNPRPEKEINNAFWRLFATIPANPFYQQNFQDLFPVVKGAAIAWLASNELQREHPALAKTLSLHYINLIAAVALICGGFDHAVETARVSWLTFMEEG